MLIAAVKAGNAPEFDVGPYNPSRRTHREKSTRAPHTAGQGNEVPASVDAACGRCNGGARYPNH